MNNEEIITFVQSMFDENKCDSKELLDKARKLNGIDHYKMMTAYRMFSYYLNYRRNKVSKNDFEVSLRNYLLLLNTSIRIYGFTLDVSNPFGLYTDEHGVIHANFELPDYVNSNLIRQVYLNGYTEKITKSKYNLITNPYIEYLTGYKEFKSMEQKLSVIGALNVPDGYSCMVAMSTGSGKSLITQTVAYQKKDGLSIIIVPTISLMLDQEKNAKSIIRSEVEKEIFTYYSGENLNKFITALKNKTARMLFVSPEALIENPVLKNAIIEANNQGYLKNLIIDEAHIITEWGASFRVEFQCIDSLRKNLMEVNPSIRTYLLSATFSYETVEQLKKVYSNGDDWIEIRCDKLRSELRYDIMYIKNSKRAKTLDLICKLPHPMIVYVRRPCDAENLSNYLKDHGFRNFNVFTGKTSNDRRNELIRKWSDDEFDLMIATCAFGVGVDKKDIRTVLHLYVPENANKYYQEAGRGGRDGLPSISAMLYTDDDYQTASGYSQKTLTVEKFYGRWFSMMESIKSVKNSEGVILDTSVRPDYNIDDDYPYETSNADVDWNVNVILMLRKNGVITIKNVNYMDGKFLFHVSVIDKRLMNRDEESLKLFEEIRDKEYNSVQNQFDIIKQSLKKLKRYCWSEMFNDVYSKTRERCSGCNSHTAVIDSEMLDSPLKDKIDTPLKKSDNDIFCNSSNILMFSDDFDYSIKKIITKGIDVVIIPNNYVVPDIFGSINFNTNQIIMNYEEFLYLISYDNYYYLSGSVAVLYDDSDLKIEPVISSIWKLKSILKSVCILNIAKNDFSIGKKEKKLSERLDATYEINNLLDRGE